MSSLLSTTALLTALLTAPPAPGAPPASTPPAAPAPASAPARAAPASPAAPVPPAARANGALPRYSLDLATALGAFYARSSGWVRSDAQLHLALGIRLHRAVQLRVAFLNSVERLEPGFRVAVRWLPWHRGLYAKAGLDVMLAGVGAQPAFILGVGYAWWFRFPLGLYAELETAGRVRPPLSLTLVAVGGLCAHF